MLVLTPTGHKTTLGLTLLHTMYIVFMKVKNTTYGVPTNLRVPSKNQLQPFALWLQLWFCVFLFLWFSDMQKTTYPTKTLAQGCEYTTAAATNVQLTWRRFGWIPMAEVAANEEAKSTVKRAKTPKEVSHA